MTVHFALQGALSQLRIPPPVAPLRNVGLWRHTCFETFVAVGDGPGYWEFNFSPSGEWATYRFSDYRASVAEEGSVRAPVTEVEGTRDRLELSAAVYLEDLMPLPGELRLGLCAVIESKDGGLFYWALRHPAAEPDFHHPDSFALVVRI